MTARLDTDRLIATWLSEVAPERRVDYLDETLTALGAIGQRPAWASPARWLPNQLTGRRMALPRLAPILLILALLLAATIVVLAIAASRPRLPAPYGLAAPGLVAFESGGDIVATLPDGTGRRTLIADVGIQWGQTWSHRGDRFAYWSAPRLGDPASLWVADADGRNRRLITGSSSFVVADYLPSMGWSSDDRKLAFTTDLEHGGQLFVVTADGSDLLAIGDDTHKREGPVWSPDDSFIAYTGQSLDESDRRMSSWVITPDGRLDIEVIPAAGSSSARTYYTNHNPSWSPDGRSFLVHTGQSPEFDISIARLAADGTWSHRVIVGAPGEDAHPAWSSSGTHFSFIRFAAAANGQAWGLMVADADGSSVHLVTDMAYSLQCWSPDDRFIRVTEPGASGSDRTVRLIQVDGSSVVEISAPGDAGDGVCPIQRLAP